MKPRDLEIDESLPFQKKFWVVQRVGWALMVLIVIASLIGWLGQGFFNKAIAQTSAFTVTYPPFGRLLTSTKIQIAVPDQNGRAQIGISSQLLDSYTIQSITPEPDFVSMEDNQIIYTFQVNGDLSATFTMQPEHPGIPEGTITVQNESVEINQVIYP